MESRRLLTNYSNGFFSPIARYLSLEYRSGFNLKKTNTYASSIFSYYYYYYYYHHHYYHHHHYLLIYHTNANDESDVSSAIS